MSLRAKHSFRHLAIFGAGCVLGVPVWALPFLHPRTTTEYDHTALLVRRTYSWGGLYIDLQQYEPFVRAAADKYLQARGWQPVPSGGAETIWCSGNLRNENQLEAFYAQRGAWGAAQWGPHGLGAGWTPGFGQPTTSAMATPENHFVLDIFDTASRKLVFRGVTTADFSGSDKQNHKRFMASLKRVLKSLPSKR